MPIPWTIRIIAPILVLCLFKATTAAGQATALQAIDPQMAEATGALRSCLALAEQGKLKEAAVPGRRAESLFDARLKRNPRDVEVLVALARSLSQCVLPSAELMDQGELSTRALELLDVALTVDSTHWTARFMRASINYRSPAFLGRAPLAAKDLDELLRVQPANANNPRYARIFEQRGVLWSRAGRVDSAHAVWVRGASLYPADTTLRGLAERAVQAKSRLLLSDSVAALNVPATAALSTTAMPPVPIAPPPAAPTAPAALGAVHVVASPITATVQPSVQRVTKSQVLIAPGGGADVYQAIQALPGATRVSEGSDVYTRGGSPDETATLIDGGRLATLSRFEGLNGGMFGAIEPFVVRSIRYSSGGFSVRHGNVLSGVVEIETDGRPRERQMRAGLSLVQVSGTARLPVNKKIGGWVNARVSHTGALLAAHGRTGEFVGSPHSEEIIASVISNPSVTSELRATAIVVRDDARSIVDAAGWRGLFHAAGGSKAVMVSSRWIAPRAPITMRTNIVGSTRRSEWDFGVLARLRNERGVSARSDVEWSPTEALTVRSGVEQGSFTRDEKGAVPLTASVAPGSEVRMVNATTSANQLGAYVETQVSRNTTSLTVGIRADRLPGEHGITADPRIALTTQHGAWTARVGAGLFHQGRWRALPTVPDAGTPSGFARSARHLIAGLEREGANTSLHLEAYDKQYGDYSIAGAGPPIAAGSARGVDVVASRSTGRVTGSLGYSLLDATLQLANGRKARSPYDVTHSITGTTTAKVNDDWSVGTTLRYGTGGPHTPIHGGEMQSDGRVAPLYGALMTGRLPAYARADARVMRYIRLPSFLLTTFAEVLNVTNRHNVSAFTYDASYSQRHPVHSFFAHRTIVVGGEFQFR